jgi:hypothetical protein
MMPKVIIELSSYSPHFVINPGVIASSRELKHSTGLHDGINAWKVPSGGHTVALRTQSVDIAYSSKQFQCVRWYFTRLFAVYLNLLFSSAS